MKKVILASLIIFGFFETMEPRNMGPFVGVLGAFLFYNFFIKKTSVAYCPTHGTVFRNNSKNIVEGKEISKEQLDALQDNFNAVMYGSQRDIERNQAYLASKKAAFDCFNKYVHQFDDLILVDDSRLLFFTPKHFETDSEADLSIEHNGSRKEYSRPLLSADELEKFIKCREVVKKETEAYIQKNRK